MRKYLLYFLLLLSYGASGQCDTVTNITASSITSTSATITWTAAGGTAYSYFVDVKNAATNVTAYSTTTSSTVVSATGLTAATGYRIFITTFCSSGFGTIVNTNGTGKYFTTISGVVPYTPMTANGYLYKRQANELTFHIPYGDTTLNNGLQRPGALIAYTGDTSLYHWNGLRWVLVGGSTASLQTQINEKVDSVTTTDSSICYWVAGVSYCSEITAGSASGIDTLYVNGAEDSLIYFKDDSRYAVELPARGTSAFTAPFYFVNSSSNPTLPGAFENNVIMQPDGVTADNWYRTGEDDIYYTTADNGLLDNWTTPVLTNVNGYFPTVFEYGGTYYMFIKKPDFESGDIYLYSSSDKTTWAILNGGDPVIEHSPTATSWFNKIYNVGVSVVGTTLHIVVEGLATSGAYSSLASLGYASADITNPVFTLTATPQLTDAYNADMIYVPEKNALLIMYSEFSTPSGIRTKVAKASLASDLTIPEAWYVSPFLFTTLDNQVTNTPYPADFSITFTPGKTYPAMLTYNWNQSTGHQGYLPLIHTPLELFESFPMHDNTQWYNVPLTQGISYMDSVGIGKLKPLHGLDIGHRQTAIGANAQMIIGASGNSDVGAGYNLQFQTSGSDVHYQDATQGSNFMQFGSTWKFRTAGPGSAGAISFIDALNIKSSNGYVGILQNNPLYPLHITRNQNAFTTVGQAAQINLGSTGASIGSLTELALGYEKSVGIGSDLTSNDGITASEFYVFSRPDPLVDAAVKVFRIKPDGSTILTTTYNSGSGLKMMLKDTVTGITYHAAIPAGVSTPNIDAVLAEGGAFTANRTIIGNSFNFTIDDMTNITLNADADAFIGGHEIFLTSSAGIFAQGVDSASSPENVLWIDQSGKIRRTAVPTGGGGGDMAIGGTVTSGSTSSVLFVGSGPVLAQDNTNFRWDNTNKRLGIKKTPDWTLDVAGDIAIPYNSGYIAYDASNNARYAVLPNNNKLTFGDGGGWTSGLEFKPGGAATLLITSTEATYTTPVVSTQYKLSSLNTAPSSASDTGTTGEVRITATYIYVCIATNTWVRAALSTW